MVGTLRFVVLIAAAALAVVAGSLMALAQSPPGPWMAVDAVRAALVDRPVAGIYPDGQSWRELMRADGSTSLTESSPPQGGSWHFNALDELCFVYTGEPATGGCFRYVRISANCYEHFFREGNPDPGTMPEDHWLTNGVLWRSDVPSTCDARPSV